jgi:hypothetical protein
MTNRWSALFRTLTADTMDTVDTVATRAVSTPQSVNSGKSVCREIQSKKSDGCLSTNWDKRIDGPFADALAVIERRCPDYVPANRWRQAVEDGRRFLDQWGETAAALGWTPLDLFGLHAPPHQLHPSYQRLSRYDGLGLIWLLCGRATVALTKTSAAIQTRGGARLVYRRSDERRCQPAPPPAATARGDIA